MVRCPPRFPSQDSAGCDAYTRGSSPFRFLCRTEVSKLLGG